MRVAFGSKGRGGGSGIGPDENRAYSADACGRVQRRTARITPLERDRTVDGAMIRRLCGRRAGGDSGDRSPDRDRHDRCRSKGVYWTSGAVGHGISVRSDTTSAVQVAGGLAVALLAQAWPWRAGSWSVDGRVRAGRTFRCGRRSPPHRRSGRRCRCRRRGQLRASRRPGLDFLLPIHDRIRNGQVGDLPVERGSGSRLADQRLRPPDGTVFDLLAGT